MKIARSRFATAFTLIELLVVIAIIAVLASILFPVFAQARAKAREAKCLSNMKQIGIATQMYLQDFDGTYFDDGFYTDPKYGTVNWTIPRDPDYWNPARPYLLAPYLKNSDVLICAQEREVGSGTSIDRLPQYAINKLPSQNGIVPPDKGTYVGPFSELRYQPFLLRTDAMVDASNTLLVWEHNSISAQCNIWSTAPGHWDNTHHGGFTTLWCDGHAKRMMVGQLQNKYVTYWAD